jgi:hypothetical protein
VGLKLLLASVPLSGATFCGAVLPPVADSGFFFLSCFLLSESESAELSDGTSGKWPDPTLSMSPPFLHALSLTVSLESKVFNSLMT